MDLVGFAVPTEVWRNDGPRRMKFAADAFDYGLAGVELWLNHNRRARPFGLGEPGPLARTRDGSLEVTVGKSGVYFRASLAGVHDYVRELLFVRPMRCSIGARFDETFTTRGGDVVVSRATLTEISLLTNGEPKFYGTWATRAGHLAERRIATQEFHRYDRELARERAAG